MPVPHFVPPGCLQIEVVCTNRSVTINPKPEVWGYAASANVLVLGVHRLRDDAETWQELLLDRRAGQNCTERTVSSIPPIVYTADGWVRTK